eukprot:m51a1_g9877 hypothetical protein (200) ;mRNA; r:1782-2945
MPTEREREEAALAAFAAAFFWPLGVAALPPAPLDLAPLASRGPQVAVDALQAPLEAAQPPDSFALLGLTAVDLYVGAGDEFTVGVGSMSEGLGLVSLYRYDPARFPPAPPQGEGEGEGAGVVLLRRAARAVAHEVCHMMGMGHCLYYRCLMNGSGCLAEDDSQPLHLCPDEARWTRDAIAHLQDAPPPQHVSKRPRRVL